MFHGHTMHGATCNFKLFFRSRKRAARLVPLSAAVQLRSLLQVLKNKRHQKAFYCRSNLKLRLGVCILRDFALLPSVPVSPQHFECFVVSVRCKTYIDCIDATLWIRLSFLLRGRKCFHTGLLRSARQTTSGSQSKAKARRAP